MKKLEVVVILLFFIFLANRPANSQLTSAIWIADDKEIRKIAPDGTTLASLTSVFGKGFQYGIGFPDIMDVKQIMFIDQYDGCVWITDVNNDRIFKIGSNGVPLFEKSLWSPIGISIDPSDGSIWTSELFTANPSYTRAVIKLDSNGERLVTVTGFSSFVSAISLGESGSVWVADRENNQIVKLFGSDDDLDGYDASALTGSNHARFGGFPGPSDFSVNLSDDSQGTGNVWVANSSQALVVKLSPQGVELVRIKPTFFGEARHVSVNFLDGSVWTGSDPGPPGRVANISATGDELLNFSVVDFLSALAVNPADDTLWVGVYEEVVPKSEVKIEVRKLDYSGTELLAISGFKGIIRSISVLVSVLPVLEVNIDIKAGSYPNCININDHGVIPIAILGAADFDVTQVDPATCECMGMTVKMAGKSNKYLASYEDVNLDGFDDLVVKIEDSDAELDSGAGTATLTCELYDGTLIEGTDTICIVP